MRTTLDIDEQALAAAMACAEGRTQSEVVNEALRAFARKKSRKRLLGLRGKVEWTGDLGHLRKRC